jgi:hypothetical protein
LALRVRAIGEAAAMMVDGNARFCRATERLIAHPCGKRCRRIPRVTMKQRSDHDHAPRQNRRFAV